MTKEEKRTLFCALLNARPHGDGPAKLAKWCHSSPSTIYFWQKPEGSWPREEKEKQMWDFFGYVLDKRGNPHPGQREIVSSFTTEKGENITEQWNPNLGPPNHLQTESLGEFNRNPESTSKIVEERKEAVPVNSPFEYDTRAQQAAIAHALMLVQEAARALTHAMAPSRQGEREPVTTIRKGGTRKKQKRQT